MELTESDSDDVRYGNRIYQCIQVLDTGSKLPDVFADGSCIFNYFNEASNLSMSSVVANFSLINKIYIPKYIFPLSKCLFVGINFLLTLIPLYAVIILTGTGLNIYHFSASAFLYFLICIYTGSQSVPCDSFSISEGYVLYLWNYYTDFILYDPNHV